MAQLRQTRSVHGLCAWLLVLSQVAVATGCRQAGAGRSDSASFGGGMASSGASTGPDLGQIIYDMYHSNLQKSGTAAQVAALEAHKDPFIAAVDRALPTGTSSTLWATIRKFLPLVDDDTIPNGVQDVRNILVDMSKNAAVCQALADLSNQTSSPGPVDQGDMVRMAGRLLAYPDIENLARSSEDFVKANPGLIDKTLGILSRQLQGVTAATFSGAPMPGLSDLAPELLRDADMGGFGDTGAPGWAVLLDKNNNPAATVVPATGKVIAPFVDDGTGVAAVNKDGKPIDAKGVVITTKPFGSDGSRDSFGRALGAGGFTLYQYVDVKRTTLGQILILSGDALKKDLGGDIFFLLDKLIDRQKMTDKNGQQYEVFAKNTPFCDLMKSNMELVRRTQFPQLLSGIAELDKQNPAQFEDTITSLILALNKAKASGFTSAGQATMINDLIPLLHDACSLNGKNTTAVRALLEEFTKAQAQLHDLPKGFARMMKFHDYGKQIPTSPGNPSVMQRLLDVMKRSDQCSPPFLGNLAELYIDTMAGNNKAILGIKLDIHTMNNLMKIGLLRSLLCSKLNGDDAQVLQDFADTGALDAFIPIAKAFSDRGETRLLVDIMLKMGDHYQQAMAPNEAAVVKLLESGAVEKLFVALDHMTTVKIPGTNEVVADVLADTIAVMVDTTKPMTDRHGRTFSCLLLYLKQPLDDIDALALQRGEKARWDRIVQNAMDIFLATYVDPATKQEKIRASGLIHGLGKIIDFMSKQIPMNAAQRSTWCDQKKQAVEDLIANRDLCALVDIVKVVKASPQKKVFDDALANLLTPQKTAKDDALGAIAVLIADVIQAHPKTTTPVNGQALATTANFFGAELDPALGKVKQLINMIQKVIETDDGLLLLHIAQNATDEGPNGNLDAPIVVIMDTLNAVKAAGPQSSGPLTGKDVADSLTKSINFIDDNQNGVAAIFARIKARNPK